MKQLSNPVKRLNLFLYLLSLILPLFLIITCTSTRSPDFLGSAVIESETVLVSTTARGMLVSLAFREGQRIAAGDSIGIIDTVPLVLKQKELVAAQAELIQQRAAMKAELAALRKNIDGIKRELDRVSGLVSKGALPVQQKDNLQTQYESSQLKATAMQHQLTLLDAKQQGIDAKNAELIDQITRCRIVAPSNGTVLTVYKNPGEVVGPGNPIIEIGRYDTVHADFFIPQPMLAEITIGKSVRVRLDNEGEKEGEHFVPATITWISDDAEFSPKNIQTRESRNELVFRVRATIPNNDRLLKRGLPVEIWK